jgi:hypothetical protein
MTGSGDRNFKAVKLAFEQNAIVLRLDQIVPLKTVRPGTKTGKKYAQIVSSVRAIGLVEAPVVTPDKTHLEYIFCSTDTCASKRSETWA